LEHISVIIPTYNRQDFLPKALDSVLEQTHCNFEVIIVDDGSTDGTKDMLRSYNDKRIRYIFKHNQGPAAARNSGIKAAKFSYIAFLDSDDWFAKEKLEIQLDRMEREPHYPISHTDEIWYRRGKLLNQKKKHHKPGGYIFERCLELCTVSMSTVMIRRELFENIGLFDESLPCCEDYDFWLRASVMSPFLKIDQPLTLKDGGRPDEISVLFRTGMDKYRIKSILSLLENNSLSSEQRFLAKKELHRKCLIYGNGCIKHGRQQEGEYYLKIAESHC
jgi:glycosyltransferase involved in cell wall biosynthesis